MQLNHPNINTVFDGLKMALTGVLSLPNINPAQQALVTGALTAITQTEAAAAADPYAVNPVPALHAAIDAFTRVFGSGSDDDEQVP